MVLRRPLPLAIVALMAVPASAADQSVTASSSNDFTPAEVTVDPGEKVTWRNGGGFHNVKFDDGSFEQPAEPDLTGWTAERTFDTPGTFRYYCEAHGGPNGSGMAGRVVVRDPNAPPTHPAPEPPGLTVVAPEVLTLERLLERGLHARVRCANGCDAALRLSVDARTAKRLGFPRRRTVVGSRTVSLARDGSRRVTVSLTRWAKRRLRQVERSFEVRLDVRATRESVETARRTIEIKP